LSSRTVSQNLAEPCSAWTGEGARAGTVSTRAPVHLALGSESSAVGAGGDAGVALEEAAEIGRILIADGVADFLHGAMVALQQALGGRHSQLLQVDQRAVSRGVLEAPDEIAQAHAHPPGRRLQREGLVKILVQP